MRAVFDAPTVAGLADYLDRHQGGAARAPLMARERPVVVPLSFAQQRLWFLGQLRAGRRCTTCRWRCGSAVAWMSAALGAALGDVMARHESLRTVFAAVDGVPQQVVVAAADADFGWRVVDAGGWSAGRLEQAVGAVAGHGFDLAAEIPVRATLFRLGAGRARVGGGGASHRW